MNQDSRLRYLEPGDIIRSNDPCVTNQARSLVEGLTAEADRARALFYFVRDQIRYNPYSPYDKPEHYWPAATLKRGEGYCVQKSVLLAALARATGMPARLVFADIVNHRLSEKLLEMMKTNVFVYHGYVELLVQGRWIRVTPVFEKPLCEKLDIKPVDFDGLNEAIFHRLDNQGRVHIEYVKEHGIYADVPLDEIMSVWREVYPLEQMDMPSDWDWLAE
ncbi:MAG: transglutaminase-like domain-containing protein [Proteobacteria bacterium]|nr:transglutaminase-like domain-containing protein [Pseudomonadota bacterium]